MPPIDNRVLDVSNHDASTFDVACLRANGITRIILGCQIESVARSMAIAARAEGLDIIGAYVFLKDPGQRNIVIGVQRGITICREFGIRRLWLDCEAPDLTADEIRAARHQVEAAGLLTGIYTGTYVWRSYGDPQDFADLPLWHAEYGRNDGLKAPVTTVSYGGWTAPVLHQYASTIPVCGRERDHNYLLTEDDEMSAQDKARLDRLERVLAANGIEVDGVTVTGEDAMKHADAMGWSAMLNIQQLRQRTADLEAEPAGGGLQDGDVVKLVRA